MRSFVETYHLPAIITNCSNNYGAYQHPEKLIPLMIIHALEGKKLPIYGDGSNVRDWLHVSDHCAALMAVSDRGRPVRPTMSAAATSATTAMWSDYICDVSTAALPRSRRWRHASRRAPRRRSNPAAR